MATTTGELIAYICSIILCMFESSGTYPFPLLSLSLSFTPHSPLPLVTSSPLIQDDVSDGVLTVGMIGK